MQRFTKRTDECRSLGSPLPLAGEGQGGGSTTAPQTTAWVLSDGRAGHEAQSLGIAEALGLFPQIRRIAPRGLFALLAPFGPIDPRDAPRRPGSPIAPPFPDILIAAGRRTLPYLRRVKHASSGRAFTVYINDPRTGAPTADMIVAPRHDGLCGDNVVSPLTPSNRLTHALLTHVRENPDPRVAALPCPRVALLIGGTSCHYRFTQGDVAKLANLARSLAQQGKSVMATASRRTPPELMDAVRKALAGAPAFLWDGSGENPYLSMLANADAIVVTADSVNMAGEAAATGAPIHIYEPTGGHPKIRAYLDGLATHGAIRAWTGKLENWRYEPINSTPQTAAAIAKAYAEFRARRPNPLPVGERGRGAAG
ncbi:MAG: mitochondrial fission ELM1 family protein [Methylocystis sp.]|nr:mitochondrial fission ELM1 family protein [Methylocystis sp.]